MKIIEGKNAVLGRLASYAAKEVLKGEEVVIVNCDEVIISGNRKNIEENFRLKRGRIGTAQKGPQHARVPFMVVKRTIRGMLPEHRWGRGKDALKRVKCYNDTPKEFEKSKKIEFKDEGKIKFITVRDMIK